MVEGKGHNISSGKKERRKGMDNASKNEQNPKIMQNKLEAESCKQAPLK